MLRRALRNLALVITSYDMFTRYFGGSIKLQALVRGSMVNNRSGLIGAKRALVQNDTVGRLANLFAFTKIFLPYHGGPSSHRCLHSQQTRTYCVVHEHTQRVNLNVLVFYVFSCARSQVWTYWRNNAFARAFLVVFELLTSSSAGVVCAHLP